MKDYIKFSTFLCFGLIMVFAVACSPKTAETTTDNNPPKTTSNEKPNRPNRPQKGQRKRPTFEKVLADLDTDKDGKLSKEEAKGPLAKSFSKADTNEDGFITEEEFNQMKPPKKRRQ